MTLAGVLAGCVTAGPRDAWVRVSSPRFELYGATSKGDAEDMMRMLEQLRTALLAIVFDGKLTHPDRMVVILADGLSQYAKTASLGGTAANAAVPALGLSEVLILDADTAPRAQLEMAAKHELTHAITVPYAPGMPHWYAEGLAGIFETVVLDKSRGVVTLERWDRRHQRYVFRPLSVDDVFAWQAPVWSETSRMQYATAIQLMQMLQMRYPQQLTAFETAMHAGTEWEQAWANAFAGRTNAQLTKELQAFALAQQNKPNTGRVSFPLAKPTIEPARSATKAETHAARALLYALAQGRRSEKQALTLAKQELEAALSGDEDPEASGLVAAALLYDACPELRSDEQELARIRRVLTRDPTNWRAAILLSGTAAPLSERTQALERVAARGPNDLVVAALDRIKLPAAGK